MTGGANKNTGLTYSGMTIGELVSKDTDGDGIPDWEEKLWGTDPTKKETTPGIPDSVAIEKLKAEKGMSGSLSQTPGNLTETDKFSRDLFTTIAAISQDGQSIDQTAVDKISSSLVDNVRNSSPKKTYQLSDIKIGKTNTVKDVQNYILAMSTVTKAYKGTDGVLVVLKEFTDGGDNPNASVLLKLGPIIDNINKTMAAMIKTSVPQELAQPHLDVINGFEKIIENLNDMKLYDSDAILALSGVSQYNQNNVALESAIQKLKDAMLKGLKS